MFYNEFMPRPEYIEITCKSAVNRVQGMPYLKWSLNPYGGCVHRCRFCFAVQYRVVADQGTISPGPGTPTCWSWGREAWGSATRATWRRWAAL